MVWSFLFYPCPFSDVSPFVLAHAVIIACVVTVFVVTFTFRVTCVASGVPVGLNMVPVVYLSSE